MNYIVNITLLLLTAVSNAQVVFSPANEASSDIEQIRAQFPEPMKKAENPFQVTCDPETSGYGNWADNNTVWVYNLEGKKDRWGDARPLPGGSTCKITQVQALESVSGKTYQTGSLQHQFVVNGPNVTDVLLMPGINGGLKESEPVFMVVFDGDIDTNTLLNSSKSFLWYSSKDNLTSEKLPLMALAQDKVADVFKYFESDYGLDYRDITKDSKNWALVTTNRNLIPGANINLSIDGVVSSYSSKAKVIPKDFALKVRQNFKANVNCERAEVGSAFCMPEGQIYVGLNAKTSWNLAKSVYIEYVPQNSTDGRSVKAYPNPENVIDSWLGYLAYGLNLPLSDDVLVSSLDFSNIKVAPETIAKVVFPQSLLDVDGRSLETSSFDLSFGSFSEIIEFPKSLTIMERKVEGNTAIPVSVMDLNQKIKVTKSGLNKNVWQPVTEVSDIIDVIVAYNKLNSTFTEGEFYQSPMADLNVPFNQEEVRLSGQRNKKTFLYLNYPKQKESGLYIAEIASELSSQTQPSYNLTMLTDLNVTLKKGNEESVAWVTSYSTGLPVADVKIEVFDCNSKVAKSGSTDTNGLFKFSNLDISKKCSDNSGTYLLSTDEFFVTAKSKSDIAFTHTSYNADNSWAFSSPGLEYFDSSLQDNSVYIHSLIAVNLVKPGQSVPVQLTAVMPNKKGFGQVDSKDLPKEIKVSSNNSDISYTFPLSWSNGLAEFVWEVPEAVELGTYSLQVQTLGSTWYSEIGSSIEVAEFEVPLMTANITLQDGPFVKPTELNVSGMIRFSNGIGAPDQSNIEVAYYFAPTSLNYESFEGFNFVQGEYGSETNATPLDLPSSDNVASISSLSTNSEGTLALDLAQESLPSGEKLSDLLAKADKPYNFVVRMRFQDQGGQWQTVSTSENVYSASSYLGTKVTSGPLKDATFQVVNLGIDGKAYTNLSDLNLSVKQINTYVIGEEVFGGFVKNTLESELVNTNWKANCNLADGIAVCSTSGLAAGNYLLAAESKTNGQKTYSKFKIDSDGILTADGDYYFFEESVKGLTVASDKEFYKGSETAKLSFDRPFDNCVGLVTLERANITESYVDQNACKNGFVKVKVNSDYAPNIFASVYLVAGRSDNNVTFESLDLGKPSYRLGFANLKIDWEKYALDVKVSLDKAEYRPRELATATVEVTPLVGSLTEATVTFFAIEEKILELKENTTVKILDSLMGLRGHSVQTLNSYGFLNSAAEVEATVVSEAVLDGGAKGLDEGGSGSEFEDARRELFDALVSWETRVPLINGKAQITFEPNDKLTKFKVFAVVSDAGNKFGTGEGTYLSAQEVQTYSNISSVGRTGDEFPAMITVQNNGEDSDQFSVVLDYTKTFINGKSEIKTSTHTINVAKGGSVSAQLEELKIEEGVSAIDYIISVYNKNGVKVDSLGPIQQKISPSIPLTVQDEFLAQIEKGEIKFDLIKNSKALPAQGSIDTKVFGSLVTSAEYAIRKSLTYDIFSDLTIEGKILKALIESDFDSQSALQNAFSELISQVDQNGFVKYYSGASKGDFWMTAELVQILSMKPWALSLMPKDLKAKLVSSFKAVIEGSMAPENLSTSSNQMVLMAAKIKAANALASMGQDLYSADSMAVLDQLETEFSLSTKNIGVFSTFAVDTVSDMAVLVANVGRDDDLAKALAKYIDETLTDVRNTSAVIKDTPSFNWWGYNDEIIATAKILKARSLVAKVKGLSSSANYLDNFVTGLIQANKGKNWYTLKTKAWVLVGLSEFAKTFEAEKVAGKTSITSTESSIGANVSWRTPTDVGGVATEWLSPAAQINVSHVGEGKPWVSVLAESAVKLTSPNYQGLKITKVVKNITYPGAVTNKIGDLMQVDITIVSSSTVPHVALFDPIPSGANILTSGWGNYSSEQKTFSGYKIYFNSLDSGESKLSYQYQLNNPGTFELPQTRVEALYEKGLFGEVPNAAIYVVK